jgi:DNA-binding response OmpR family regulator
MRPERKAVRALIVDDEAELSGMLALRLRAAGLEVRTAADGAAGLAEARAWRPDVVMADLQMPGLDGWQLCAALRADAPLSRVPVLLMTAWRTPGLPERARAAGAAALWLKPFDERRLPAALTALARRRPRSARPDKC